MPTFRKKPVEIEAQRWGLPGAPSNPDAMVAWLAENGATARYAVTEDSPGEAIAIETLEGTMLARPGDWIIRGVQGEFYPCKADIFSATYDRVNDMSAEGKAERTAAEESAIARFFTASNAVGVVALRDIIVSLGTEIDLIVPAGRNKALALTALEDVQMRANRGIFASEGLR